MKSEAEFLANLSENTRDYWSTSGIKILNNPTAVEFLREAVSAYQPVIIRGCCDSWAAMQNWSMELLKDRLKDATVNVNWTPDGLGDCVIDSHEGPCFVYPLESPTKF